VALRLLLEAAFAYNEQTSRVPPMQNEQVANVVRFGSFELNTSSGELTGDDGKIPLQDQPFQILKLLTERPGEVVTREEIRSRLWPDDTVVEFENAVNAAIKKLRIALGDSAEGPRYVETLRRRGYRLMFRWSDRWLPL
jgi:DNA-binding winged helix-turn-helix (wHTH) protein